MHHCDVLCLVLSSLCSLQAYNYAEYLYNILALNYTSPPTHFTRAPPSVTCKEPLPEQQVDDPPCK